MSTNPHIYACTPTHVYRDIHTFMHTCMNSYIKTSPLIITSTTDKGENDIHSFIQSGYFYSASLSPLLLRGAPDHSNWQCRSLHDKALQATVYSRPIHSSVEGKNKKVEFQK